MPAKKTGTQRRRKGQALANNQRTDETEDPFSATSAAAGTTQNDTTRTTTRTPTPDSDAITAVDPQAETSDDKLTEETRQPTLGPPKRLRKPTLRAQTSPIRRQLRTTIVQKEDNSDSEDKSEEEDSWPVDQELEGSPIKGTRGSDIIVPTVEDSELVVAATPRQRLPVRLKQTTAKTTQSDNLKERKNARQKKPEVHYSVEQILMHSEPLTPAMLWSLTIDTTRTAPSPQWTCSFCKEHTQHSKDTARIAHHVSTCQHAPSQLKERLLADKAKSESTDAAAVHLSAEQHDILDTKWLNLITERGLPLDLGEAEQVEALFQAIGITWRPPSRKILVNNLVPKAVKKQRIELLERAREQQFNTLISDGWSNLRGEKLLNLLLAFNEQSGMLDCKHLGTMKQDAATLYAIWKTTIKVINPEHVAAIVLDGAANNNAAKRQLKQTFPHLELLECVSHRLNLVAKDWMRHPALKKWLLQARKLVRWIRLHGSAKEHLREHCKDNFIDWREPATPGDTRWQGIMQLLQFLLQTEKAIREVFDNADFYTPKTKKDKQLWAAVHSISQDDDFWQSLPWLQSLFKPLYEETVRHEAERSTMSEVYPTFCRLKQQLADLEVDRKWQVPKQRMYEQLNERYHSTIHALMLIAYLGDPVQRKLYDLSFTDYEWTVINDYLADQEATIGHEDYADSIREQLENLSTYEAEFAVQPYWQQALPLKARHDLDQWRSNPSFEGSFTKPKTWWKLHFPRLALTKIMVKALSLRCSTGPAERNWSAFGFIHSKKRNSLTIQHAFELTFLYYNARMKRRQDKQNAIASNAALSFEELQAQLFAAEELPTELPTWEETPPEERMVEEYILNEGTIDEDWDELDE